MSEPQGSSPDPTRAASPTPLPVPAQPDPASARSDVDLALEDLARERTFDPGRRPSTNVVVPGLGTARRPDPGSPGRPTSAEDFYNRKKASYHEHIGASRFAEAIRDARALVDLTARGVDDPNVNHALWLRNLGVTRAHLGDLDEARRTLEAALALCESDAAEAQLPRMTCLIDLADLALKRGESWLAQGLAGRALLLMRAHPAAAGPVRDRAGRCFERIRAHGRAGSGPVGVASGPAGGIVVVPAGAVIEREGGR